ncbi:MAG TPA: ABC transporter substrate-binding protein [Ktedonobacteraceae bacterium]|nr:ABC transporter substrate-binding protein [Ktedonobacteraceae bacterium]
MLFPFPKPAIRRGLAPAGGAFVGVLIVLTLLLAACGSSTPSTSNGPDLITPGVLTVGSDTTYPPQEYIDTNTHQAAGFDIDLITAVASKMGLKAQIVTAKFDSIIESLAAKRYDVVISAVSMTPERQKKADFIPYFNAGESLLVQQGNPKNIKSTADLCGLDVGVQNGTIEQTDLQAASDACKKAGKPEVKTTVLQDQTAVIQLLQTNRVVATYQDSPVTDYYLKQNPGRFEVGGSVVNAAPEGIVVRKGDKAMFNAVQTAFNTVKSNGTYHTLIEQWGLTSGALAATDRRTSLA